MFEDKIFLQCEKCGFMINRPINENYRPPSKALDLSYTYDGYLIVSGKFRSFVQGNNYSGVMFQPLEKTEYSVFSCSNVLEFDAIKRETRFIDYCDECDRYAEVIGATPIFLKGVTEPLDDGFYRSDIEFGTGSGKHPIFMIGVETYLKLNAEKFSGLENSPIIVQEHEELRSTT